MTTWNKKSRALISLILIASTLGVFIYAQGADLTLDAVDGIYNARWLNGTDAALANIIYVDTLEEFSLGSGITIDAILVNDSSIIFPPNGMASYMEGMLGYDQSEGALYFDNDESDIRLQIGQEAWVRVRNIVGSTIEDGKAVYISGASGGIPEISLAQSNAVPQALAIGLATHDIENGTIGYVTINGIVRGLNTSTFSNGDLLFLSASTPGALTTVQPSDPNFRVQIGYVALANGTGKILVDTGIFGDVTSIRNAVGASAAFGSDNLLIRSDGVSKSVQATGITIDDLNNMTGVSTIDTGQGPTEVYLMDQDLQTSDAVTFITIDTGQGANELYAMNQDVQTSDSVIFTEITLDLVQDFLISNRGTALAFQGQTPGSGSEIDLFSKDGDGSDNIIINLWGIGGPASISNRERLQIQFSNADEFRIGSEADGSGILRPIVIFTEGNTDQLIVRTDGDIEIANNLVPDTNNTGSVGENAVRFADGYFVTLTAKNTVTGKIIENEITANPLESFEEGDLVQILDTQYFTKTKNKLANVIGVVTLNPGNIQIGTETSTEWVDEIHEVTKSVSWIENVTDAYGQVYEVERTREDPVTEWYLEMIEDTLSDGGAVLYYENRTRIKTETVPVEVTTEIPIMGPKNEPVLCVFGGPTLVKISEPVLFNDVLVASAVDGKARPLRTVLPELVEQYGGMEMNFENVLSAIEKLNYKTLGRVMEDSTGDTCWAMIGY